MKTNKIYQRHRYHSSIISHCVWLYYRFTLSYRDIELIMMQKGISVTYESIRYWCVKFGKIYAKRIKKTKQYGDYVYMDEVFCKIKGKRVYLWRAVDQDGQTIDVLVQEKRDCKAKMRKFKSLKQAQLFLSSFGNIYDHFNCARHLCSAKTSRILAERRFKEWEIITQVTSNIQN